MATCMQESAEYQSLKKRAGVPDLLLETVCLNFLQDYGRYPHLDEIPGSNSESDIKETLKVHKNGSTIKQILDATNSKTIQEAAGKLNNIYRDKEIIITPVIDEAFIDINTRPTDGEPNIQTVYTPDAEVSYPIALSTAISKLVDVYNIKVNEVNDRELASEKWKDLIPRDRLVNAFVYNGEIYINTDRCSPDSRIHEMLHLLAGSMRFTNPTLYQTFINMAEQFPNYDILLQEFSGKTRNDANEEIFIQELSKYLSGMKSQLDILSPNQLYEINYNVHRTLDSILMGSLSSKSLSDNILYNMSIKELVDYTNSDIMTNTFFGTMNIEGSELHRKLNNMKSDLIRKGLLEEICD